MFSSRHLGYIIWYEFCLIISYDLFARFGNKSNEGDGDYIGKRLEEADTDGWLMRFPSVPIAHVLQWVIMTSEA